MRFRNTYGLLGLFVVLLLVVIFFENSGVDRKKVEEQVEKSVFSAAQVEKIDKIVFDGKESDEQVLYVVEDGQWMMSGYRVDPLEYNAVVELLMNYPVGKVVSKNKENWGSYGLEVNDTSTLSLFEGDRLLTKIYFGNQGTSFVNFYLRRDDDDQVYLVKTNLTRFFGYEAEQWRDKRLFVLEKEDVKSVTVRLGEERWRFEQDGKVWKRMVDSVAVPLEDLEAFDEYLDELFGLRVDGFEGSIDRFVEADNAVALSVEDGSEYIVQIDKLTDDESVARVSGQAEVSRLSNDLSARLRPYFLEEQKDPEVEVKAETSEGVELGDLEFEYAD